MALERNNDQFRILFSVILTFKKENKTTNAHCTTKKGHKKQSSSEGRHGIYRSTESLKLDNCVFNDQL